MLPLQTLGRIVHPIRKRLWIVQLNAAVRGFDISYSQFINGLALAEITIDRKVLAEMTVKAPEEFATIVNKVKETLLAKAK